jgi:hypothetical protein
VNMTNAEARRRRHGTSPVRLNFATLQRIDELFNAIVEGRRGSSRPGLWIDLSARLNPAAIA